METRGYPGHPSTGLIVGIPITHNLEYVYFDLIIALPGIYYVRHNIGTGKTQGWSSEGYL